MSDDTASGPLLHQRHTMLILRLTLEQHGQLYQGVVIAPDGQVMGRFRNWQELVTVLEQWLSAGATTLSI